MAAIVEPSISQRSGIRAARVARETRHALPIDSAASPAERALLGGGEEGLDFGLGRDASRTDAAQAQRRDGIREPSRGQGRGRALRRLDEERGREDIASAGQIDRLHLVAGQIGLLPAVDDPGAILAFRDHAEPARANGLNRVARVGDLLVADDDRIEPADQLRGQAEVMELDASPRRAGPIAHPALRRRAEEGGSQGPGLLRVDLLRDRSEVDQASVPPVGRQPAQVNGTGPTRDGLHAPSCRVLIDEDRRRLGVLNDDAQLVRVRLQRRNLDPADAPAECAAREDADAPAETGGSQGRVQRRAAENRGAIGQQIGADMADDEVFRRACGLQPGQATRWRERLPRHRRLARWRLRTISLRKRRSSLRHGAAP